MTTPTEPVPPPPPPTAPRNGFGITALVLALIGLVFGLLHLPGFLALTLGVLAVLFGLLGWFLDYKGIATDGTMAGVGTVVGAGAIVLGLGGISITLNAVDQPGKDLQSIGSEQTDFAPRFTMPTFSSPTYSDTAGPLPSPSDFTIDIKVLRKACFPSYGCNVTYEVDPTYTGSTPLAGRTFTVIYEVTGGEYGPRIDNFKVNRDGTASAWGPDLTSTSSSGVTLKATVMSIED